LSDDDLLELAREHRAIVATIRDVAGEGVSAPGSFDEIVEAASGAPLCYLIAASAGGAALIVTADGSITKLLLPILTITGLNTQFADYHPTIQESGDPASKRAAIFEMGRFLGETTMRPLSEALGEVPRVVLIPSGLLGMLPLHAGWWTVNGRRRYAIEDRLWTYAASARSHRIAHGRGHETKVEHVLAVEAPRPVRLEQLPWAPIEVEVVVGHFRDSQRLKGADATHDRVVAAMPGQDVLHFACHGIADTNNPMRSRLILANDVPLLLAEVLNLPGLSDERPE
jgi:hypothetical protein